MAFEHAVARAPISGRARQTGLVLAHFMGADGVTWVGQRRLAHEWGIRHARWKRDIAEIVGVGLVEVTARVGERGSSSYRSRARFVSQTSADIVLEDGSILPAASAPSETLTSGSASAPSETLREGSASPFSASASSFSASASAPSETNHQTTTPPSGGGGGGGAVPAAASASATAAGPAYCGESAAVQGVVRALQSLLGSKTTVPVHDRRLNGAIAAKLDRGWAGETLAALAADNPPPAKIGDPGGFWAKRFAAIDGDPYVIEQAPPATDTTGTMVPVSSSSEVNCPHCDSLASGHQPSRCFFNPLAEETTRRLWFGSLVIVAKDLGHNLDGSIWWRDLDSDHLSDAGLQTMVEVAHVPQHECSDPCTTCSDQYEKWGSSYDELFPADITGIEEMNNDMRLLDGHLRDAVLSRLECSSIAPQLWPRIRDLVKVSSRTAVVHLYRLLHAVEDFNGDPRPGGESALAAISAMVERAGTTPMITYDDRCWRCGAMTFCAHRRNGGAGTADRGSLVGL